MNPRIRQKLHEVIYEADTPAGRRFDLLLLLAISLSVLVTMLDSVEAVRARHGRVLDLLEWTFTVLFAIEYALRLLAVTHPLRYAGSPLGIIDLLGWLPTLIELLIPGSQYLTTVRVLRILRVFRVLKLSYYLDEARFLADALRTARRKILVFLSAVLMLVTVLGSIMYLVESGENGFTSIPQSIYWSIVTLTTVGYGDISPGTVLGKFLSSVVMILGYAIIAVPTGIVSAEFMRTAGKVPVSTQACPGCSAEGHAHDARFCRICGEPL